MSHRRTTKARKKTKVSLRKTRLLKRDRTLKEVGKITHYFPKVKAGIVKVTKGTLTLGDVVHIKGHTTDFKQKINSVQLDHAPIEKATKGQEVGIKVKSRVRQHDIVYQSSR